MRKKAKKRADKRSGRKAPRYKDVDHDDIIEMLESATGKNRKSESKKLVSNNVTSNEKVCKGSLENVKDDKKDSEVVIEKKIKVTSPEVIGFSYVL